MREHHEAVTIRRDIWRETRGEITGAFNNAGSQSMLQYGEYINSGGSEMGTTTETEAGVGGIAGFIASNAVIESVNFGKVESIQCHFFLCGWCWDVAIRR